MVHKSTKKIYNYLTLSKKDNFIREKYKNVNLLNIRFLEKKTISNIHDLATNQSYELNVVLEQNFIKSRVTQSLTFEVRNDQF